MTNIFPLILKHGKNSNLLVFLLCFFVPFSLSAQHDSIINKEINQVIILGKKDNINLKTTRDGITRISVDYISSLPKIMGNADPVHYLQMMPGVQTNSEYDSGIHIQGCDNTHNYIAIDDAPIYNAGHMLGFFSVFNPEHFKDIEIAKTPQKSDFPNRLGGCINMKPNKSIADSATFAAEFGLISSQGAATLPIGSEQTLMLAIRKSYLNMLYSNWIKIDETSLRYSFSDFNIRYIIRSNYKHQIYLDLYHGNDVMKTDGSLGIGLRWGNDMAAFHWNINKSTKINNLIYFTRYHNFLDFSFNDAKAQMPSDISSVGEKTSIIFGNLTMGVDLIFHNIKPQTPQSEYNNIILNNSSARINVAENNAYLNYKINILENTRFEIGARGGVYIDINKKNHYTFDPNATISQSFGTTELSLNYSARHQNIFQTGCSTVSLPTDFWYATSHKQKPQLSHGVTFAIQSLLFDSRISISADAYYKRLHNQTEYSGTLLDLATSDYDINNYLMDCKGYNYGFSVMINKRSGKFNGWISYSFGRAWRNSEIQAAHFPATHERPHEVDMVATYHLLKKIDFGATFVYASGSPFTSPDYFYLLNGNIMMHYGNHNACRLKPYIRLDAAINIHLHQGKKFNDGINISVYNVLGRSNDIYYTLKYYNGEFRFWHVTFLLKQLPNISYYIKF